VNVPKTIGDLNALDDMSEVYDDDFQPRFSERPHSMGIKGRFVPDDLLRARFAFAGQKVVDENAVVLSREEAKGLLEILEDAGAWYKRATEYYYLIKSKLPAEQPKEKP